MTIDKKIWTHEDFKEMGWHDSKIYGMTFEKKEGLGSADLIFDIDYIFKWFQPVPPSKYFTFYVAPCTLIFTEAFGLQIEFHTEDYSLEGLEIVDLQLLKTGNHNGSIIYHWNIELTSGTIKFQSQGFTQIVRKKPMHVDGQSLSLDERGGINFSQIPY